MLVTAIPVTLYVGDGVWSPGVDQLNLLRSNQIGAATVRVYPDAQMSLGAFSDVISGLQVYVGPLGSSRVSTVAGLLTVDGTLNLYGISGGNPVAATISGKYALRAATGNAQTRTFEINDYAGIEDLVISAAIEDGDGVPANLQSITKTAAGRLRLSGNNTFSGATTVAAGELLVASPTALGEAGTVAAGKGTIVNTANNNIAGNASLLLEGGITVSGEGLRLDSINNNTNNGTGYYGTGVLRNLSGANTWAGDVTLRSDNTANYARVTVMTDAGSLNISGIIDQTGVTTHGVGLIKIGRGMLEFSGPSANTYGGTGSEGYTFVREGTLKFSKAPGVNALGSANLYVGNDAGGPAADTLVLGAANQIPDTTNVIVRSEAEVDLNNNEETLGGTLTLTVGTDFSAHVSDRVEIT